MENTRKTQIKQNKQGETSTPSESPKDEEQQFKTGSPLLDNLLETSLDESLAAAYVCLRLSRASDEVGDRIETFLEARIKPFREGKFPNARDKVGDYLKVCNWLAFLKSFEKTTGGPEDNSIGEPHQESSPDKEEIISQVVEILRTCQPIFLKPLLNELRRHEKSLPTQDDAECAGLDEGQEYVDTKLEQGVCDVLDLLNTYDARFQHNVLSAALEKVTEVIVRADKLIEMEDSVRDICERLDAKTKCVIAILQEVAAVEGCSIGVDYGYDLLYSKLRNRELVEKARKDLPNDHDVACLGEAYELASFINEAS
jgi:hypothetical protein